MSDTETIESPSERAKVESWRLHVLIEAGFRHPAERIAVSEADLPRGRVRPFGRLFDGRRDPDLASG